MLVAEEEHKRHWVVELVHLLEVRNLIEIAYVEHGEVLDTVRDPYGSAGQVCKEGAGGGQKLTVEDFILAHAVGVPIASEAYDYQAFFF